MHFGSKPQEVRDGDQNEANSKQKPRVRDEVRYDHQGQATEQWNDRALLPAIDEKAKPNRAEQYTQEERRGREIGHSGCLTFDVSDSRRPAQPAKQTHCVGNVVASESSEDEQRKRATSEG